MSAEKFPTILSRQMEAIVYIYRGSEHMQQQQQTKQKLLFHHRSTINLLQ